MDEDDLPNRMDDPMDMMPNLEEMQQEMQKPFKMMAAIPAMIASFVVFILAIIIQLLVLAFSDWNAPITVGGLLQGLGIAFLLALLCGWLVKKSMEKTMGGGFIP